MPELTDEQVWEAVYRRYPRPQVLQERWVIDGTPKVVPVDGVEHRAHIALNVLWPEIVASESSIVVRQSIGKQVTARCPVAPGHIKPGSDPATAIARLWGEVCGG